MASTTAARKANGEPAAKTKSADTGTKVVVRRLPPCLTEDEFWSILGPDWKPDGGNVDWARFDQGKVAKDPLRSSRPAECHLHVVKQEGIATLTQAVQEAVWHDARNTFNDTCLVGPPCVERALYQKVPGAGRIDPRAGTIDLEPSFQAFLNNLANPQPASKENPSEKPANDEAKKDSVKVTSTHLTEFIKEKAEKAKAAAASAKSAKHARQESQGTKGKGSEDSKKKGKDAKSDKTADKDKPKEPIKLLTKKAATQEAAEAAKSVADQITATKASEETPAAPTAPKSRRAAVAAAAKLLQRDLGLSPGSAHRRARQDAAKAEAQAKAESNTPSDSKDTKNSKESKESKDNKDSDKLVPTGPKAQASEGSSRRSRGKAKADTKGKGVDTAAAASKPTTGPIILLKKETSKQDDAAYSPAGPSTSTSTPTLTPPTGPKASAGKAAASSAKSTAASQQKKATTQPTPGATRAFVKHANPSQGVTEALLKQAMEAYGNVTFVEIDKRKGFAYVDFGDHQSLCKAIAASPVAVASGTVQVLERKDKKPSASAAASSSTTTPAPAAAATPASAASSDTATADRPRRGGRGRGRRGGGGGNGANGNSEAPAA